MKTFKMNLLFFILFATLIILVLLPANSQAQDEEQIIGVVKATDWQDDKVVSAALLITSEEEDEEGQASTYVEEYPILDNKTGKELFKLDGQTVEVSAVFLEEDDGTIYLKVNSYRLLDNKNQDPGDEDIDEEEIEEPPIN